MSDHETGIDDRSADLIRELEAVLGRRVDELEIENTRLRRSTRLLAAAALVALALSIGTTLFVQTARGSVADVVQARQFVLRDAAGHVRAVIGSTPEGGSRFSMQDRSGQDRLRLTLLADGSPGLSFADTGGRSRAVLAFLPDETVNLVFADRTGRTRAVFGLMPDESSTLVFADRMGETRVGLGVDASGGAGLSVFERDGVEVAVPHAEPTVGDTTVTAAVGPSAAVTPRR
jgi:hypothetical protein